jgi:hypothetical protein
VRLPRFRIRTLILAVAVAAVVVAGKIEVPRLRQLRDSYVAKATYHSQLATVHRSRVRSLDQQLATNVAMQTETWRVGTKRLRDGFARLAAYDGSLAAKYERAASYPWITLEPDPPRPPDASPN